MIVVDGVVGVGKSTLMNILAERGLIAYEEGACGGQSYIRKILL